jgi:Zn-dependent M28 family amino/carboxypeptidase
MKKLSLSLYLLIFAFIFPINAQTDKETINSIFENAVTDYTAYEQLRYLCKNIGPRLTGSPQAAAAVEYFFQELQNMGFDTVYLQETTVPNWIRGEKEVARIISSQFGTTEMHAAALGLSVETGIKGISAEIIEVKSFEELAKLGEKNVKGKIVFFNRPAFTTHYQTGAAYGGAVEQRTWGAVEAAKHGAIATIVRSVGTGKDFYPHTGVMRYKEGIPKIPAIAISTNDADILSQQLKAEPGLKVYIRTTCKQRADVKSYNVIAEIQGSENPNNYITVGGHLDSWDLGEGAHDDGTGVVQSIEVLRLFKELKIKPKNTIRAVLFMDEEIMQRGGASYAEQAKRNNEKHLFAIESDGGGTLPLGFSIDASDQILSKIQSWQDFFIPWGIYSIRKGGSGVDVDPLKGYSIALGGLIVNSQGYFDLHHAPNDVFEMVNQREMQLGAAGMAALIYLIDKNGLE